MNINENISNNDVILDILRFYAEDAVHQIIEQRVEDEGTAKYFAKFRDARLCEMIDRLMEDDCLSIKADSLEEVLFNEPNGTHLIVVADEDSSMRFLETFDSWTLVDTYELPKEEYSAIKDAYGHTPKKLFAAHYTNNDN